MKVRQPEPASRICSQVLPLGCDPLERNKGHRSALLAEGLRVCLGGLPWTSRGRSRGSPAACPRRRGRANICPDTDAKGFGPVFVRSPPRWPSSATWARATPSDSCSARIGSRKCSSVQVRFRADLRATLVGCPLSRASGAGRLQTRLRHQCLACMQVRVAGRGGVAGGQCSSLLGQHRAASVQAMPPDELTWSRKAIGMVRRDSFRTDMF